MSAKYESKVEENLRTRVTGNRLGFSADQVEYQLRATDIEAAYSPNEIGELTAIRDRLYQLADEAFAYVEKKKLEKKATPAEATAKIKKSKLEEKKAAAQKGLDKGMAAAPAKIEKEQAPKDKDPAKLTVAELRVLYRIRTGTPAPSKWNKKALVEAVRDANAEAR